MLILINSVLLLILFVALGWLAELTVNHIKRLGAILKIRLFVFGLLLGIITSLPELSLGINATINQVAPLSVGNIIGGVMVMLGLILGVSILLNRKIKTDGRLAGVIPALLVTMTPIFFGLNGYYGATDGLIMIGLYLGLVAYLYRLNRLDHQTSLHTAISDRPGQSIILAISGTIGILIVSHYIVVITVQLLEYITISKLTMGLIVFSLGTNLPEISIALTSWRKKSSELSLSHLLSSSFTNTLILGVLAFLRPINFNIDATYWLTAIFMALVLICFAWFYKSHKKMDRREGLVLLALYILFVVINFLFE
ncbi:MAG TPA: hypothetical protein PKG83_00310 [bacterium]|nr:hypothetical protein [bacterium]HNZ73771.1 hypothetical protein [bacterium]HOH67107.1 hypothetical protein [bacterium]HQA64164.1 hypothetical protein [bacterium]